MILRTMKNNDNDYESNDKRNNDSNSQERHQQKLI